jgi:hypothetical protein
MPDLKVLNVAAKRGTTPDGWTPDQRFIVIEYQFSKRSDASDVATQSKRPAPASSTLLQEAVAALNKRR